MKRPTLKLGIVDQVPVPHGATAEQAVRNTLELAREAERLGYARYWLAEHHSTNSFACGAPDVLIARVAAETRRLRVGSGGVLLPHYSPLEVAERFRMLEALFAGRIDLGVGRAPGGTSRLVQALRYGRGEIGVERFAEQVDDLLGWLTDGFADGHPWRRVRAMPRVASAPDVWLLGSSGSTARMAAERGCGYAFAQFISGVDGSGALQQYRAAYRPRAEAPAPRAAVAVGAVCADTDAEAERLALSLQLWRGRIARGMDRGIPTPEQAEAEFAEAGIALEAFRDDPRVLVGSPARVRERLLSLADAYGTDEVLLVTVTHSHEARMRSYQLIAEAMR